MKAEQVTFYDGRNPPCIMFETKDGFRYTPEQWRIMVFLDRVEGKLDKITKLLEPQAGLTEKT